MKFAAALAGILLSTSFAHADVSNVAACEKVQNKQALTLAYPAESQLVQPVDVQFQLTEDHLIAQFSVRTESINAKPVLGPKEYPYQGDVVELFISVAGNAEPLPYFEFELSPYDNTFEVRVDSLKKAFVEGIKTGFTHEVERHEGGWTARMTIPLTELGWNGEASMIRGNAYAILGKSPNRSFWSLSLPKQLKPNFHKPEFFKPLLDCSAENEK